MKSNSYLLVTAFFASVSALAAQPFSGATIFDDRVSLINISGNLVSSGASEVRWGTFTSGVFSPYFGAAAVDANDGYIGNLFGAFELTATLSAVDNTVVPQGSQLFLSVTFLADNSTYRVTSDEIVLTDPSWLVPSLVLVGDPIAFSFTPSTSAVKGVFSFSPAGSTISAIPEPSSFAAIAGLSVLGLVAARRRRSA